MSTRRLQSVAFVAVAAVWMSGLVGPADAAAAPEAPETTAVSSPTNSTATFEGVLDPHSTEAVGWYFDYKAGNKCTGGSTTPLQPEREGEAISVRAPIAGLAPATEYTVCLAATNASSETTVGGPVSFKTTEEEPTVEAESFSGVGSASVQLRATINSHGSSGSFDVEYGTTTAYSNVTASQSIGANPAGAVVTVELSGLQPETAYHFRFVATSTLGSTPGPDASFSTLPTGLPGLPDGRVAEMVTPAQNQNADVYVPTAGSLPSTEEDGIFTNLPFQAAADGDSVAYVAAPTAGGNGSAGDGFGNQNLATRTAPGVWSASAIQPGGYVGPAYQVFSENLSAGILDANPLVAGEGLPPLTPNAPDNTDVLYTRDDSNGSYSPLFTATPPRSLFTAGIPAENDSGNPIDTAGASQNFEDVLFEANGPLTSEAVDGGEEADNLYDSHDSVPSLINILPNETSEAGATFGAPWQEEGETEPSGPDLSHVISADGSRVFWTDLNPAHKNLYLRENPGTPSATTIQVDEAVGGGGTFWTASSDGSKVYFTKGALYQYDVNTGSTSDLTPGAEVQGVLASSEDGSYVYFVSRSALATGATAQTCDDSPPTRGESLCNLYLYREGQPLEFITTLQASDGNGIEPFGLGGGVRENGDWIGNLGHRTAQATPDGQSLVFMSSRSLTGFENAGFAETYVYNVNEGLSCVSCDPSGEPPNRNQTGGIPASGYLPVSHSAVRQIRWISASGNRVFFDSLIPLVPQDRNGKQDVYEWERDNTEGCHTAGGCLRLLSGGTSTSFSWLLDSSTNGDDVFIITRARLAPTDENENYDVYDDRVGGQNESPATTCTGAGCTHEVPPAPSFGTPASVGFSGIGNFAPPPTPVKAKPKPAPKKCKKGYVRHKNKCVKAPKKKAKKKTQHKATKSTKGAK